MTNSIFTTSNIEIALFILIFAITIFLLVRDLLCWYWKINERISLLQENIKTQNIIIGLLNDLIEANISNKNENSNKIMTNKIEDLKSDLSENSKL